MTQPSSDTAPCVLCGRAFPPSELMPSELIRPAYAALALPATPTLGPGALVCREDLDRLRSEYVERVLAEDKGELSELEHEVVRSIREQDLLTENINAEFEKELTLGERAADRVAAFGGSWTFLAIFALAIVFWVALNARLVLATPFDPFPYILLNLILSCLAAVQAPVIMMSQNRQEAKDRLRSEHDYRVDLKAELEVRHLNAKLDFLLNRQWQRLLEVQQLQTDMLKELRQARGQTAGG
jgi:uncharacterized membrane protein